MPEISRFLGIIIRMFFAGAVHNPPHFHAYYGELAISRNLGPLGPSEAIHANTYQNPYLAKNPATL